MAIGVALTVALGVVPGAVARAPDSHAPVKPPVVAHAAGHKIA